MQHLQSILSTRIHTPHLIDRDVTGMVDWCLTECARSYACIQDASAPSVQLRTIPKRSGKPICASSLFLGYFPGVAFWNGSAVGLIDQNGFNRLVLPLKQTWNRLPLSLFRARLSAQGDPSSQLPGFVARGLESLNTLDLPKNEPADKINLMTDQMTVFAIKKNILCVCQSISLSVSLCVSLSHLFLDVAC